MTLGESFCGMRPLGDQTHASLEIQDLPGCFESFDQKMNLTETYILTNNQS